MACKKILNSTEFRYNSIHNKEDMVSHAVLKMLKYDYFYKFDGGRTIEGFSWMTTIVRNWFYDYHNIEMKQTNLKYGVLREYKTNLENQTKRDLSDLAEASLVKGVRMTFYEFRDE